MTKLEELQSKLDQCRTNLDILSRDRFIEDVAGSGWVDITQRFTWQQKQKIRDLVKQMEELRS